MQIRVANRQDEPAIRAIVNECRAQRGEPEVDLKGADSDLNNVEEHYFWFDGIFLVAEEEGTIIGLIGARRGNSEETLDLRRLAVSPTFRGKGTARALVDRVIYFAGNLDYKRVVMDPARQHLDKRKPLRPFELDPAGTWTCPIKVEQHARGCSK
jgi:N-acetylglutamate synthase-like GNAT family acetyltransferase